MSASSLSPAQKTQLAQYDAHFSHHVNMTTLSTVTAVFLSIIPCVVIVCSLLYDTFPGCNALQQIYPEAITTFLASIPFYFFSFYYAKKKKETQKEWTTSIHAILHNSNVGTLPTSKSRTEFLEGNILNKKWNPLFTSTFIDTLKEGYPAEEGAQTSEQKALIKALDKAKEHAIKNKKA